MVEGSLSTLFCKQHAQHIEIKYTIHGMYNYLKIWVRNCNL